MRVVHTLEKKCLFLLLLEFIRRYLTGQKFETYLPPSPQNTRYLPFLSLYPRHLIRLRFQHTLYGSE